MTKSSRILFLRKIRGLVRFFVRFCAIFFLYNGVIWLVKVASLLSEESIEKIIPKLGPFIFSLIWLSFFSYISPKGLNRKLQANNLSITIFLTSFLSYLVSISLYSYESIFGPYSFIGAGTFLYFLMVGFGVIQIKSNLPRIPKANSMQNSFRSNRKNTCPQKDSFEEDKKLPWKKSIFGRAICYLVKLRYLIIILNLVFIATNLYGVKLFDGTAKYNFYDYKGTHLYYLDGGGKGIPGKNFSESIVPEIYDADICHRFSLPLGTEYYLIKCYYLGDSIRTQEFEFWKGIRISKEKVQINGRMKYLRKSKKSIVPNEIWKKLEFNLGIKPLPRSWIKARVLKTNITIISGFISLFILIVLSPVILIRDFIFILKKRIIN